MPISGGVYTRSNGTHTGSTTWAQDYAAGTGIVASVHDVHDQDIATALNTCVFKDGSNAPVANLPMGGFKHTGAAQASGAGQYVEYAQFNTAIAAAAAFPSGTKILFYQASAPTGWTQDTTNNDCLLRVVSGTGGGAYTSGTAFSTVNATAVSGTIGGTSITQAQLPICNFTVTEPNSGQGHAHSYTAPLVFSGGGGGAAVNSSQIGTTGYATTGITVSSGGSGSTHTHSFTGAAPNINYISVIVCTKN